VLTTRELFEARVIDAVCASEDVKSRALAMVKQLAAQPAFGAVKRQIRGRLAERLAGLASTGEEPFLAAFGGTG
jgi:hypothetical protein